MGVLKAILGRTEAREYVVGDLRLEVEPEVWPPSMCDTKLLVGAVPKRVRFGQSTVEVGTGCGVVSILAQLRCRGRGVAVDINKVAVDNARLNAAKHGVDLDVRESDLWRNVPTGQFDWIFANGPHHNIRDVRDPLDHAWLGEEEFNRGLLAGAWEHMHPGSRMLVVFAQFHETPEDYVNGLLAENRLQGTIIAQTRHPRKKGYYHLYEVRTNERCR